MNLTKLDLTVGLFFVLLRRCATVFLTLLGISRLFPSHVAGIKMVLTFGFLAGLLLVWVFIRHSLQRGEHI
jgi:hypothetical protein